MSQKYQFLVGKLSTIHLKLVSQFQKEMHTKLLWFEDVGSAFLSFTNHIFIVHLVLKEIFIISLMEKSHQIRLALVGYGWKG